MNDAYIPIESNSLVTFFTIDGFMSPSYGQPMTVETYLILIKKKLPSYL